MKTLLFLTFLFLTGCTKNYVDKCYLSGDGYAFIVVDQDVGGFIKVYIDSKHAHLASHLDRDDNRISCDLVERYQRWH